MGKVKLSNEEIIEIYKSFVEKFGKTPTQKEMNEAYKNKECLVSVHLIHERFGGLIKLNKICGITLVYKTYTDDEIINMVKEYCTNFGYPKKSDICKTYNISEKAIWRFKGFDNLLKLANIEIPKNKQGRFKPYKNISDKEALRLLKEYCDKFGIPKVLDYTIQNNLPSLNMFMKKFNSLENALNLIGYEISEEYKKQYHSIYKKVTDDELIDILRQYHNNIGFPVEREFTSKNNLPAYTLYFQRFGSFKNAILISGIDIPKEREMFFDRETLSDEEMLKLMEHYTDIKLNNDIYLLTNEDIDNIKNMPHSGTYNRRFGGIVSAYEKLGIDYYDFNNKALEKDMIIKYKELYNILGRTPNSRDINKYSQTIDGFYSMGAYEEHFGGVYKLQIYCDMLPTIIGRQKSKEELIEDLQELYERLGRVPTQRDVDDCEWIASSGKYFDEFGNFTNALKIAGFKDEKQSNNCLLTPQGNYCRSSYEYDFCTMLEDNSNMLEFWQEDYYYNYIKDYTRRHRFDFTVKYNNKIYPIEIFGMMEHEWYREKTKLKIDLCKNNNINLIDLYKEDFKKKDRCQLYEMLMERIKEIDNK